jgi:C1A family cysteine protease
MLELSPAGRRYGYRKDRNDNRDFGVARARLFHFAELPAAVDLESFCGAVKDQGQLGACTAFAGTGMREFIARKYQDSQAVFSPLFLYYKEREFDGDLGQGDTGSEGRTSVHVMNQVGVCLETTDPYDIADFERAPTDAQVAEALNYRSGAYHRIATVEDMKSCLASGYVFVVGFTVYASFESLTAEQPFYRPDKNNESILGGHEVLFIGYDESKQAFKVRNSWGAGWCQSGDFWFPYDAANDSDILMDAWIQHLGKPW